MSARQVFHTLIEELAGDPKTINRWVALAAPELAAELEGESLRERVASAVAAAERAGVLAELVKVIRNERSGRAEEVDRAWAAYPRPGAPQVQPTPPTFPVGAVIGLVLLALVVGGAAWWLWPAQDVDPDLDGDHDGISDVADKCPKDAEDADGVEDNDGCPDPDAVVAQTRTVELRVEDDAGAPVTDATWSCAEAAPLADGAWRVTSSSAPEAVRCDVVASGLEKVSVAPFAVPVVSKVVLRRTTRPVAVSVLDSTSGKPVGNATVTCDGATPAAGATDAQGAVVLAFFDRTRPAELVCTTRASSYGDASTRVGFPADGRLEVKLKRTSTSLIPIDACTVKKKAFIKRYPGGCLDSLMSGAELDACVAARAALCP